MKMKSARSLVVMGGIGLVALLLAQEEMPGVLTRQGRIEAARAVDAHGGGVARDARAWNPRQLIVALHDPNQAEDVASAHGARTVRAPGPSGLVALEIADAALLGELRAALDADARVKRVESMGRIFGAGRGEHGSSDDEGEDDAESATSARDYQWHLDAVGAPGAGSADLSGHVVAVLDTGVAFESYEDDLGEYVQIPSLASVEIVAPYDFVYDDYHPNDDHQHGTHVACLIACDGDVEGVAPGVSLMPLKVLDMDNAGNELDLIDAIYYAVENGADIINMSLAFSEGYVPSESMRQALETASAAGVLMVAAAGNEGSDAALYPAASPLVIGVGASQLETSGGLEATDYSNSSTIVDLMAPGGNLEHDNDGDGYVDGILAETIDPDDLTSTGLWFYAGTSQSTALVAGAAVHLLDAGLTSPQLISQLLEYGSDDDYAGFVYRDGTGAGNLNIQGALDAAEAGAAPATTDYQYSVAILPYLAPTSSSGKNVRPTALLTALDADGEPAASIYLVGSIWSSSGRETFKCRTDANGECTVEGAKVAAKDSSGAQAALAWGFSVDAAIPRKSYRLADAPGAAFFVTDALVLITEALEAEGLLAGAPLAIGWEAGTDDDFGRVAESYAITDLVAGAATRTEALLFTPSALADIATFEEVELDLDALGLTDESLGTYTVTQITLNGSGLVTDPLGLTDLRFIVLSGKGLVTDPLGFKPSTLLSFGGAGLVTDPLGFTGQPVLLASRTLTDATLSGYSLGSLIAADGFVTEDGYPPASGLMSSGAVGMDYDEIVLSSGAATATPMD